jgi:catalase
MDGLTTIQSSFGPKETLERLEGEIRARGMTVFARINHAALAQEAGMALRPTEVVLFGNPRGGTPLMQANQTIGIDLPLKALVWEDASGKTWLSYNEPDWLAKRHGVTGLEAAVTAMGRAVGDMAASATRGTPPANQQLGSTPQPPQSAGGGSPTPPAGTATVKPGGAQPPNTPAAMQSARPETPPRGGGLRLLAVGVVVAGVACLFAYAGGWLTPHALTPARFVETFEQINGVHPGFRRNHAKGLCVSGYFISNGQGATLCKSSIFRPGRVPVIGRFSLGVGQPFFTDAPEAVRGLGLRFSPPHGEEWRTAMVNLPVFPARTPLAFHEQLLAFAPDHATGKPDPARNQAFLAKYPESAKALQLIRNRLISSGFENSTFNSLNAFRFIDSAGAVSQVRWSLAPVQPFEPAGKEHPAPADSNYLFDALIAIVHRHPLEWHLMITLGQPGDPFDDATLPWPPDRKQVEVGTLTIDRVESDDTSLARNINFDPLILPDGIAASDDPLLSARSAIYSRSFTLREGEPKNPSAISPGEAEK